LSGEIAELKKTIREFERVDRQINEKRKEILK